MFLNCSAGEDSWESFGKQEIKPVNPKGNHSWIFIGRTDTEAETPILWPPDTKNGLIRKDPDSGKDWRQEEKGMTKDKMVGWHHWFDGHAFERTPGDGDGQGGPAYCDSRGRKESDMTEWLNWTEEKGMATHSKYSCLENSMDRGAWQTIVHGVTKSQTWLSY